MREVNYNPLWRNPRGSLAPVVQTGETLLVRLASPRRGDRAPAVILPVPTWERLCRDAPRLAPQKNMVTEATGFKTFQTLAGSVIRPVQTGQHVFVSWEGKDGVDWSMVFAPRTWYEQVTGETLV